MVLRMRSLLLCVLLLAVPAFARLAPGPLEVFLAEAELIVEATPRQLTRNAGSSGEATLTVLRVLRGTYAEKELTVRWSSEVHDQHVDRLDLDYLLFLKRSSSGEWVSAAYGRSYWPFTSTVTAPERADLDSQTRGFWFEYPMTMITLSPAQDKALVDRKQVDPKDRKTPFISMPKIKALIAKLPAPRARDGG